MDQAEHIRDIELEISTRCTIGCPACPRHTQKREHGWDTGFMDINILKDIVSHSNYRKYVFCGAYGDAIYHPDILNILEYMLGTDKRWFLETNGAHKKPAFWDNLMELPWRGGCGFIFSIDGLQDTNHLYRKRSDWDSIMYGVEKILEKPLGKRPRMKWKYLVFPYNEHQVEEAEALANKLGFDQFEAVKSLRQYSPFWFEDENEQKLIDWELND